MVWHPSAENILMSVGADLVIIIWNVVTKEEVMKCTECTDLVQSVSWNYNGSLIAATCKDKKIRVIDARTGAVVQVNFFHCFFSSFFPPQAMNVLSRTKFHWDVPIARLTNPQGRLPWIWVPFSPGYWVESLDMIPW